MQKLKFSHGKSEHQVAVWILADLADETLSILQLWPRPRPVMVRVVRCNASNNRMLHFSVAGSS